MVTPYLVYLFFWSDMSNNDQRTGVLVVNLGSPRALSVTAIRQFLRPFLMDRRVIDLPWLLRALIVYGLVLPFRPKKLIEQYHAIWLEQGSPLHVYSKQLVEGLSVSLHGDCDVALGMRYGEPGLGDAIEQLMSNGLDRLIVLPLYPQYASSTTGSTMAEVFRLLSAYQSVPAVEVVPPFYQDRGFLEAQAGVYRKALKSADIDHIVLSYHGLPVSHIEDDERHAAKVCDAVQKCPPISADNAYCYRAQCYSTSVSLAKAMGWAQDHYTTAFQSRFGKNKWIEPSLLDVLKDLAEKGVKRVAIATPAFTIDCLESLEEIAIRAREEWLELGGSEMVCLPCLNADEKWVNVVAGWIKQRIDSSDPLM